MGNKIKIMAMGVALCAAVSGCGAGKQSDTASPTETPAAETVAATEEAAQTQEISGTIRSFTGAYLSIVTDEQKDTLEFALSNAKIDCTNGILAGDQVTVVYAGSIDGTNTSKATVQTVIDKENREELPENIMVGTITDATTNTVSITNGDGSTYIFTTTGATVSCKNGMELGNWITITYKGEIHGINTKNVKVISIVDNDENIPTAQAETTLTPVRKKVYAADELNIRESYRTDSEVVGTVSKGQQMEQTEEADNGWVKVSFDGTEGYVYSEYLSATPPDSPGSPTPSPELEQEELQMNATINYIDQDSVTVTSTEEDKQYIFSFSNAEINMKYGLLEGSTISIQYYGKASSDPATAQVMTVSDASADEKDCEFVVTGTVMACSMNTLTVMSNDGAQLTCTIDQAKLEGLNNLPGEGDYVKVTMTPNNQSNVYIATVIENA